MERRLVIICIILFIYKGTCDHVKEQLTVKRDRRQFPFPYRQPLGPQLPLINAPQFPGIMFQLPKGNIKFPQLPPIQMPGLPPHLAFPSIPSQPSGGNKFPPAFYLPNQNPVFPQPFPNFPPNNPATKNPFFPFPPFPPPAVTKNVIFPFPFFPKFVTTLAVPTISTTVTTPTTPASTSTTPTTVSTTPTTTSTSPSATPTIPTTIPTTPTTLPTTTPTTMPTTPITTPTTPTTIPTTSTTIPTSPTTIPTTPNPIPTTTITPTTPTTIPTTPTAIPTTPTTTPTTSTTILTTPTAIDQTTNPTTSTIIPPITTDITTFTTPIIVSTTPSTIPTTPTSIAQTTNPSTPAATLTTPFATSTILTTSEMTTLSTPNIVSTTPTTIPTTPTLTTKLLSTTTSCTPRTIQVTPEPPPLPCPPRECGTDTKYEIVQKDIIQSHNVQRRMITDASNMFQVFWDPEAASIANAAAGVCINETPSPQKTSKFECTFNLQVFSTLRTWSNVIGTWKKQSSAFVYGAETPGTEKYTQLIWAESYLVGCAYKNCNNEHFYVCAYCPGGNTAGKKGEPYKQGAPCSDCQCGGECPEGLCIPPA